MKVVNIILFLTFGICSCSPKLLQQLSFAEKCYQNERGHLFAASEICFNSDSTFKYVRHGPSTFISSGIWKFNNYSKEMELTSVASSNTSNFKDRLDTVWVSLTGKKINIKNSSQFVLEGIVYRLK